MSGANRDYEDVFPASYLHAGVAGTAAGLGFASLSILVFAMTDMGPGPIGIGGIELLRLVSGGLMIIALSFVFGAIFALPVAVFFIALIATAERMSPLARALGAWLVAGVIAATPLFLFVWMVILGSELYPVPMSVIISFAVVAYGAGLVAAGAAWWVRYRSGL